MVLERSARWVKAVWRLAVALHPLPARPLPLHLLSIPAFGLRLAQVPRFTSRQLQVLVVVSGEFPMFLARKASANIVSSGGAAHGTRTVCPSNQQCVASTCVRASSATVTSSKPSGAAQTGVWASVGSNTTVYISTASPSGRCELASLNLSIFIASVCDENEVLILLLVCARRGCLRYTHPLSFGAKLLQL